MKELDQKKKKNRKEFVTKCVGGGRTRIFGGRELSRNRNAHKTRSDVG